MNFQLRFRFEKIKLILFIFLAFIYFNGIESSGSPLTKWIVTEVGNGEMPSIHHSHGVTNKVGSLAGLSLAEQKPHEMAGMDYYLTFLFRFIKMCITIALAIPFVKEFFVQGVIF